MRIAIVGCGKIGQIYARCLKELGAAPTAVCDRDSALTRQLAMETGARGYADHRELLAKEQPDLVCIATPTSSHYAIANDALAGGAHVLCEKPLATTLEEAESLVELARDRGRTLTIGFKFRFEAAHAMAYEWVRAGKIGAVQFLTLTYFQPSPDRDWYWEEGVTANMLIHVFDLARWYFADEPVAVRAERASRYGRRGDDLAVVELAFSNHRRAVVAGGYFPEFPAIAGVRDMVFQLTGERGYLVCQRPDTLIVCTSSETRKVSVSPRDAFLEELRSLLAHLNGDGSLAVDARDGLEAQRILEGTSISSQSRGSWVSLPSLKVQSA